MTTATTTQRPNRLLTGATLQTAVAAAMTVLDQGGSLGEVEVDALLDSLTINGQRGGKEHSRLLEYWWTAAAERQAHQVVTRGAVELALQRIGLGEAVTQAKLDCLLDDLDRWGEQGSEEWHALFAHYHAKGGEAAIRYLVLSGAARWRTVHNSFARIAASDLLPLPEQGKAADDVAEGCLLAEIGEAMHRLADCGKLVMVQDDGGEPLFAPGLPSRAG